METSNPQNSALVSLKSNEPQSQVPPPQYTEAAEFNAEVYCAAQALRRLFSMTNQHAKPSLANVTVQEVVVVVVV